MDDVLESIDTDLMEERMKVLAKRAKKGLDLLQSLVYIGWSMNLNFHLWLVNIRCLIILFIYPDE